MRRTSSGLEFSVRPRYTAGSPAAVHEGLALRVAHEEKHAVEAYLEGAFGEEEKARAKRLGLHRIVVHLHERAGGFDVTDVLMHETYRRPFKWKKDELIEVWSDTEGWVAHYVLERGSGHVIKVRRGKPTDRWDTLPYEVSRDLIRITKTVVLRDESF